MTRIKPLRQNGFDQKQADQQDSDKQDNGEKDDLGICESQARLFREVFLVPDDELISGCQPVGKCLSDSQGTFLLFALRDPRSMLPEESLKV